MSDNKNLLQGKVAVVTGAGRGIGKAISLAYARAGALISCAARTVPEIQATVNEIEAAAGRALAVQTDVTRWDSVANLFQATAGHFGGLDIVVVNAGVNYDHNLVESSNSEQWVKTLEVNLIGAYYTVKAAIPYLKSRGAGKIITIGSGLGHKGGAADSAYSSSKAGLWMLTRVLAQELWQYRISINELIPGPVKTELTANTWSGPGTVFDIESEWIKSPEDVTPLALFLATQPDIGPTAQSYSLLRRDG